MELAALCGCDGQVKTASEQSSSANGLILSVIWRIDVDISTQANVLHKMHNFSVMLLHHVAEVNL